MTKKSTPHSYLKEITITNFRAIGNVNFKPGRLLNVLCGKNGSGKSTVLGMIAQPFSFQPKEIFGFSQAMVSSIEDDDEREKKQYLINSIKTLYGSSFQSDVDNHFDLSVLDKYNVEHASFKFQSQVLKQEVILNIESSNNKNREAPRFVTRKPNYPLAKDGTDKSSSNEIFPVIYLGLRRITPIVEEKVLEKNSVLTEDEVNYFNSRYSEILLSDYDSRIKTTNTTGKKTHASLPEDRDIKMISSGEDNVGQILAALISFKRLKRKYKDYNGGLLLIDEVDATMYPGSQKQLVRVLLREAQALKLQIFLTSHSMYLIDYAIELINSKNEVNVLTLKKDNGGSVSSVQEISSEDLWTMLHESYGNQNNSIKTSRTRLYFEDKEAVFVFKSLITKRTILRSVDIVKATLGCDSYVSLREHNIPEFTKKSVVVLDGDQNTSHEQCTTLTTGQLKKIKQIKSYNNFICLPSINNEPPEKMVFNYIVNTTNEFAKDFWENTTSAYNYQIFLQNPHYAAVKDILSGSFDKNLANNPLYKGKKERNVWKMWFNEEEKNWRIKSNNPLRHWAKTHKDMSNDFEKEFLNTLNHIRKENGEQPVTI